MREIISVVAGLIALTGMVPYILDTLKGKTKPNIVSWFTWTLLTGIGAIAAYSEGAVTTAIFSGASALSTLTIVILGIRSGVNKYTRFDVFCQCAGLVGLALWQITHEPALAIVIVVLTDAIACLPTIRHAWRDPDAETWQAFAAASVGAFITMFTVVHINFTALAYPIYLWLANVLVVWVILHRRKRVTIA